MRLPLAFLLALAISASACSPASSPQENGQQTPSQSPAQSAPENDAAPASLPEPAAAPRRSAAADPAKGVRRCGWLSNPTPANWWLTDAEGQWILGTQGADQAPGMDEMPDMSTAGWVETNGHYGYGCACMTIASDSEGRVTRISDSEPKPLKQCRADRKLPAPE